MSGLFRKVKKFQRPEPAQNGPLVAPATPEVPKEVPAPVTAHEAFVEARKSVAVEWPKGAYEFPKAGTGKWYVPYAGAHVGPFTTPEAFAVYVKAVGLRDENLRKWQEEFDAVRYNGPVPAEELSPEERVWLKVKSESYRGDLHRKVLSGSNVEISRAINEGEYLKNNLWPVDEVKVRQKLIDAVNREMGV